MPRKKRVTPMKDLEIITDPKVIKVLFETTRSAIVFKHLVYKSMTVKELSDELGKNPGTILHHIQKLIQVGVIVEERTETTTTGIVQRFYRATAREFRLGISGMMEANGGVAQFARDRLRTMVTSLDVYGIEILESEVDDAIQLLRALIERENQVNTALPVSDDESYRSLPESIRNDASRIMRRFALEADSQYVRLREEWHNFLRSHRKGE